jgi:hypothetical protein
MNEFPTNDAVARILSETAGALAIARANEHARRFAAAARRAGAKPAIPPVALFRFLFEAGQRAKALQSACQTLEATADPSAGTRAVHLARDLPLHRADAELRDMVFATVSYAPQREALMPILERLVREAPGAVVPLAVYLSATIKAGRQPNYDLASSLLWTAALRWLLADHAAEVLQPMSRQLRARFPKADFLAKIDDIIAAAPPASPGAPPFRDRLGVPVQFVPAIRPDEKTLLVCFCCKGGRMGVGLNYFHRWAQRVPAHVLYLRDLTRDFYFTGIAEIGPDWASLLDFIRGLARALGVERLGVMGHSMGGFPAIRAGIELRAARAMSVSGRSNHDLERLKADPAGIAAAQQSWIRMMAATPDSRSEIACVYGADNSIDAEEAGSLARLPGVRLLPLPGYRMHNAAIQLVLTGELERMLRWVVGASDDLDLAHVSGGPGVGRHPSAAPTEMIGRPS